MRRILLVSSLIVAGVLFGMERSLVCLLYVAATITLHGLFAIAHRKPAHGRVAHRREFTGQSDGAEKQETIGHQPLMHR